MFIIDIKLILLLILYWYYIDIILILYWYIDIILILLVILFIFIICSYLAEACSHHLLKPNNSYGKTGTRAVISRPTFEFINHLVILWTISDTTGYAHLFSFHHSLLFPFYILPSLVLPTGFSFHILSGFLALFYLVVM